MSRLTNAVLRRFKQHLAAKAAGSAHAPTSPALALAPLSISYRDRTIRMFHYAAKSTPLVRSESGKLVSAKSKSGDSSCSEAASLLARRKATSDSQKKLAECRGKSKTNSLAKSRELTGRNAPGRGTWQRAEKAKELAGKRRESAAPPTKPAPTPTTPALAKSPLRVNPATVSQALERKPTGAGATASASRLAGPPSENEVRLLGSLRRKLVSKLMVGEGTMTAEDEDTIREQIMNIGRRLGGESGPLPEAEKKPAAGKPKIASAPAAVVAPEPTSPASTPEAKPVPAKPPAPPRSRDPIRARAERARQRIGTVQTRIASQQANGGPSIPANATPATANAATATTSPATPSTTAPTHSSPAARQAALAARSARVARFAHEARNKELGIGGGGPALKPTSSPQNPAKPGSAPAAGPASAPVPGQPSGGSRFPRSHRERETLPERAETLRSRAVLEYGSLAERRSRTGGEATPRETVLNRRLHKIANALAAHRAKLGLKPGQRAPSSTPPPAPVAPSDYQRPARSAGRAPARASLSRHLHQARADIAAASRAVKPDSQGFMIQKRALEVGTKSSAQLRREIADEYKGIAAARSRGPVSPAARESIANATRRAANRLAALHAHTLAPAPGSPLNPTPGLAAGAGSTNPTPTPRLGVPASPSEVGVHARPWWAAGRRSATHR